MPLKLDQVKSSPEKTTEPKNLDGSFFPVPRGVVTAVAIIQNLDPILARLGPIFEGVGNYFSDEKIDLKIADIEQVHIDNMPESQIKHITKGLISDANKMDYLSNEEIELITKLFGFLLKFSKNKIGVISDDQTAFMQKFLKKVEELKKAKEEAAKEEQRLKEKAKTEAKQKA